MVPVRTQAKFLITLTILAMLAVTVCGSGVVSAQGGKSITIAGVAGNEAEGLKGLIPLYEQKTGVKVNLIEYPYSSLFEKIVTTMQAKQSTFDLLMADDIWLPKFESEGWLEPLDATFKYQKDPDIFPVMYEAATWPPPTGPIVPGEEKKPQHLYAITILGNLQFFAYRNDLVSKPATWDDVIANGKKAADPKAPTFGFALRAIAGEPSGMEFFPMMYGYGGRLFDDNWKVTVNTPEVIEALKVRQQLAEMSPPGVANYDAAERSREMASGRAAQIITWPAEAADFMENPEVSKVIGKVTYSAPPAGPKGSFPFLGNWMLGIPASSNNKDTAYDFLTWATSAEVQKQYASFGGIPMRKSVFTDPDFNKKFPYFMAVAEAYQGTVIVLPRTPEYIPLITIWGQHLNAIVSGIETIEDGVAKASSEMEAHLKEAGYYDK